jgi:hypothetical protein
MLFINTKTNHSFTFEPYEHNVIYGPNGSYKSMFLKYLTHAVKEHPFGTVPDPNASNDIIRPKYQLVTDVPNTVDDLKSILLTLHRMQSESNNPNFQKVLEMCFNLLKSGYNLNFQFDTTGQPTLNGKSFTNVSNGEQLYMSDGQLQASKLILNTFLTMARFKDVSLSMALVGMEKEPLHLLYDDLESHLSLNAQSKIVNDLLRIVENMDSIYDYLGAPDTHISIVTHSPEIYAAMKHNDAKMTEMNI